MALKFFWRCEGTNLDATHDFTSGDNSATLASTAAINTDAGLVGTNGLDCPTASDHAEFAVSSNDLINPSLGSAAFSFRLQSFTAGAALFATLNTGTVNNHIRVELIGTNDATGRELRLQIRLQGGLTVTLDTASADLQLDTVYRCVIRWDQSNSDRKLEVYNSDGSLRTSVENTTTVFDLPTGINVLRIGESNGGVLDVHIDNVFVADAYAEPLEDNLTITSYTQYGTSGTTISVDYAQGVGQGQTVNLAIGTPLVHAQSVLEGTDVVLIHDSSYTIPVLPGFAIGEGQQVPFILTQPGQHAQGVGQGQIVQLFAVDQLIGAQGVGEGQTIGLTLEADTPISVDYAQGVLQGSNIILIATGVSLPLRNIRYPITYPMVRNISYVIPDMDHFADS